MARELTIVSVYHNELSRKLLELNGEFTRKTNPGADFAWLVGDNTPEGFSDKIDEKKFIVIPNREDYHGLGSHQHAGAMNKCIKEVTTRFVLSLDSDFYIVRNGWIEEVLSYMKTHGLAFFGVTYHTQDYSKYRYFPSVVCMFVDLGKISKDTLDFSPQMELTRLNETGEIIRAKKNQYKQKKICYKKIKQFFPARAAIFAGQVMRTLSMAKRWTAIDTARDTSYRIYARYAHDTHFLREYVSVVYTPYCDPYFRGMIWGPLNRIVEVLLPDSLRYIPRRKDSFTSIGFRELGSSDLRRFGWEEYVWQQRPFGTHIRGSKTWKRNESEDDELRLIRQSIETFLTKNPA